YPLMIDIFTWTKQFETTSPRSGARVEKSASARLRHSRQGPWLQRGRESERRNNRSNMPAHIIWKEDNGKNGWYLADGYTSKSLKTKSKRHAESLLKQYIQGKLSLERCPTVREFYGDWIEQQIVPLVRRSRIRDHKQIFNRYVLPRFGKVDLSQIKAGDLQKWQAELIESGLKVKTVRNVIDSSFRAMYKAA